MQRCLDRRQRRVLTCSNDRPQPFGREDTSQIGAPSSRTDAMEKEGRWNRLMSSRPQAHFGYKSIGEYKVIEEKRDARFGCGPDRHRSKLQQRMLCRKPLLDLRFIRRSNSHPTQHIRPHFHWCSPTLCKRKLRKARAWLPINLSAIHIHRVYSVVRGCVRPRRRRIRVSVLESS
jgi:hypothetical protein